MHMKDTTQTRVKRTLWWYYKVLWQHGRQSRNIRRGFFYEQVADKMACSTETVRKHIYRAQRNSQLVEEVSRNIDADSPEDLF